MVPFWRLLSNEMSETQKGKDDMEGRATAAGSSFANASAKFMADQTAMMTMMTAVSVNMATQMTGIFMGAMASALQKQGGAGTQEIVPDVEPEVKVPEAKVEEKPKVVPLRIVKKPEPPKAEPPKAETPKAQSPEVDDLKRISGLGPRLEKVLHDMGIKTFADIAKWDDAEAVRIDEKLGLDNRIIRDGWVKQAKALLEG